jgi:hypothetical protein
VLLELTVGATPGLLGQRRPAGVEVRAWQLVAAPRRHRGAGGDRGGVAARGCHGTTRAKPPQLNDWEAIGVDI